MIPSWKLLEPRHRSGAEKGDEFMAWKHISDLDSESTVGMLIATIVTPVGIHNNTNTPRYVIPSLIPYSERGRLLEHFSGVSLQ